MKNILRGFTILFLAFSEATALAQEEGGSQFRPEEVVVKIQKRRISSKESLKRAGLAIVTENGTGWCLGQGPCDLLLTNEHVAERIGKMPSIKGAKVLQTYKATGPQDAGAVWEKSPSGFSVKLVRVRDIAILRMGQPLKGMHGIPFSPRELREGERVKIHGYPGGKDLTMASAAFYGETNDGMLGFKVDQGDEGALIVGISGSLVLNEKSEAVGLIMGFFGGNMAVAVPVWSIADFVKKIQPERYQEIFPFPDEALYRPGNSEIVPFDFVTELDSKSEPESESLIKDTDLTGGVSPPSVLPEEYLWYDLDRPIPPFSSPPSAGDISVGLHIRVEEPPDIRILREHAEEMLGKMKDLIAITTEHYGGGKKEEVAIRSQLRMVDGGQTFTMDGKEISQQPCPRESGLGPGGTAWSDLPLMIGNNLKLKIHRVPDLDLKDFGRVRVFHYEGTAEDKVADILLCVDYGLFQTKSRISVPARGEVWTDEEGNIVRITQELQLPDSTHWENYRTSVLYGWALLAKGERILVPTDITTRADLTDDQQTYWAIGRFTDYHQFTVSVTIGSKQQ